MSDRLIQIKPLEWYSENARTIKADVPFGQYKIIRSMPDKERSVLYFVPEEGDQKMINDFPELHDAKWAAYRHHVQIMVAYLRGEDV